MPLYTPLYFNIIIYTIPYSIIGFILGVLYIKGDCITIHSRCPLPHVPLPQVT
jgi:hypothetical protein